MPASHGPYQMETYNYVGRTRVHPDDAKAGNYRCFLTWGQSQGTNVGATPGTVANPTLHFNISLQDGAIYRAADPLLSIPNPGGSIWLKLGDSLITAGNYDRVIWLPLNIGSTPIAAWRAGGVCHYRLHAACSRLAALGIPASRITILTMNGESDAAAGTTQAVMEAGYQEIRGVFDAYGLSTSPMYVPKESMVMGVTNSTIRAAQANVVNETTIKAGPDFDTLDAATYRGGPTGTDFSDVGVAAAAPLWKTALGF